MGLLDKLAQKHRAQGIDKEIEKAERLMADGDYREAFNLLLTLAHDAKSSRDYRHDDIMNLLEDAAHMARKESQEKNFQQALYHLNRKEYEKAKDLFQSLANDEHAGAQYHLGTMYAVGEGVAKDPKKAETLLQQALDGGYAQAEGALEKLRKEAAAAPAPEPTPFYKKSNAFDAARQGLERLNARKAAQEATAPKPEEPPSPAVLSAAEADSLFERGVVCHRQGDFAAAAKCFRPVAERGDADAQYNLGTLYDRGRGVTQSDTEAAKWFLAAAKQGNRNAQFNIGLYYANGRGVAQNDAEAVKWYRAAAEQGQTDAQCNLGFMYDNGRGVAQSHAEAIRWYRAAAEQGDTSSQYNLGLKYSRGEGVTKSDAEAVRWYRAAAEQGHGDAQLKLAAYCGLGRGTAQNWNEAARWAEQAKRAFTQAGNQKGAKDAAELLEMSQKHL